MRLVPIMLSCFLGFGIVAAGTLYANSQELSFLAKENDSFTECQELAIDFYSSDEKRIDSIWKVNFVFAEDNKCLVYLEDEDEWINLFEDN